MIYAPDTTIDKQLVSHSQALVRGAMALLRRSDQLVRAMRLRDELEQERREKARRVSRKSGDEH